MLLSGGEGLLARTQLFSAGPSACEDALLMRLVERGAPLPSAPPLLSLCLRVLLMVFCAVQKL